VIPARGGSKRIPRKNIKDFCGKPIIAWSIESSLRSNCFDHVIVSTDDKEIADVARDYGATVPFVRPPDLSDDHTATSAVVRHAIGHFDSQSRKRVDYACCVYATAPFMSSEDILKGLESIIQTESQYAFPITSYAFPVQRALKINQEAGIEMLYPNHMQTRSQDLEPTYHDAGQFYWGRSDAWLSDFPIFTPKSTALVLPRHRVQDIDTLEDWIYAEAMFKTLQKL
jgi:pseudaminic acid cytidylyltransferase